MNIALYKQQKAPRRDSFGNSSPYDRQFGFWGVVTEVHPESCTVHVRNNLGIEFSGVKVASMEWVTVQEGKHLTGERHLPPVDSYVFCCMPNGEYSSAFVLCSGYTRQEAVHGDFKVEGEDAANTHEKVENSGWHCTTDYRTGTKNIENKTDSEPTIILNIDQEEAGNEKIILTVHGTVITCDKDNGVNIETDKKITLKDKEGYTYETAGNVSLKSSQAGTLELGNSVATLGAMISDLLDALSDSAPVTYGSPASHMWMPSFVTKIVALKTKWGKVFK